MPCLSTRKWVPLMRRLLPSARKTSGRIVLLLGNLPTKLVWTPVIYQCIPPVTWSQEWKRCILRLPHDKRQWPEIRFLCLQIRFTVLSHLLRTITIMRRRTQHKVHVTLPLTPPPPLWSKARTVWVSPDGGWWSKEGKRQYRQLTPLVSSYQLPSAFSLRVKTPCLIKGHDKQTQLLHQMEVRS
jgi:hypothetical protein